MKRFLIPLASVLAACAVMLAVPAGAAPAARHHHRVCVYEARIINTNRPVLQVTAEISARSVSAATIAAGRLARKLSPAASVVGFGLAYRQHGCR